jgi:hypothetical protein
MSGTGGLILLLVLVTSAMAGIIAAIIVTTSLPSSSSSGAPLPSTGETSATDTLTNGTNEYSIQFIYDPPMADSVRAVFRAAAARWTDIITQDIATIVTLNYPFVSCDLSGGSAYPSVQVDDLLVLVRIENIDGPLGTLGTAGPCAVDVNGFVRLGVMYIDSSDFTSLYEDDLIEAVVIHELGHILGIGTLWDIFDLLPASLSSPIRYQGPEGNAGNVDIGGSGNATIEDTGGAGTALGHWKEDVYDDEIMTGYLSGTDPPISALTVRSLRDLGFEVNETKADSFTISPGRRRRLRTQMKERVDYASPNIRYLKIKNDVRHNSTIHLIRESKLKRGRANPSDDDNVGGKPRRRFNQTKLTQRGPKKH